MTADELETLADALEGVVPTGALRYAVTVLRQPQRAVVVGRIGVGKTTLCNALSGLRRSTGLHGVTAVAEDVPWSGGILVDTPGIDAIDAAISVLRPLVDDADAVVWVVDGLQPVTASERTVLAEVVPGGMPVRVVVSRGDLVPEAERDDVLGRVRTLARGLYTWTAQGPRPGARARPATPSLLGGEPVLLDLKALLVRTSADPASVPKDLVPKDGGPQRRKVVDAALQTTRDAWRALPPLPTAEQALARVREAWRAAVRDVEEVLEDEIARGLSAHKETARRRFAKLAPRAIEAFLAGLDALRVPLPDGRPDMPAIDRPAETTPLQEAISGFAGQEGARRALRADAGRLVAEGDLALVDWFAQGIPDDDERRRRKRLGDALGA